MTNFQPDRKQNAPFEHIIGNTPDFSFMRNSELLHYRTDSRARDEFLDRLPGLFKTCYDLDPEIIRNALKAKAIEETPVHFLSGLRRRLDALAYVHGYFSTIKALIPKNDLGMELAHRLRSEFSEDERITLSYHLMVLYEERSKSPHNN